MIRPQPFPSSPSYQAVVRALLRMHRLTLEGKDESDEADALRDSMDGPWEGLSEVERERVTGLSKDLYEISDNPGRAPEPTGPEAEGKLNEAYEAHERGEWDRALELLRPLGKYFPAQFISYLRGTVWRAAGDAATAAVFFGHASPPDADNENFLPVLLDAMETADPTSPTPPRNQNDASAAGGTGRNSASAPPSSGTDRPPPWPDIPRPPRAGGPDPRVPGR